MEIPKQKLRPTKMEFLWKKRQPLFTCVVLISDDVAFPSEFAIHVDARTDGSADVYEFLADDTLKFLLDREHVDHPLRHRHPTPQFGHPMFPPPGSGGAPTLDYFATRMSILLARGFYEVKNRHGETRSWQW